MATEAPSESQATAQPGLLRRAVRGVDPHLWDSALAFVLCAAGFVYVLAAPNVSPGCRASTRSAPCCCWP